MERLDVVFANRYFSALGAYFAGKQAPRSWSVAFEAASTARATIVQHLLLGVNAHINYDLGLAAAATLPGQDLPTLQPDFEEINRVIAAVHVDVQRKIDAVSPFQGAIDFVGGRSETAIIKFSMNAARKAAWGAACAAAEPDCAPSFAADLDETAATLGKLVLHPARPISLALRVVKIGGTQECPPGHRRAELRQRRALVKIARFLRTVGSLFGDTTYASNGAGDGARTRDPLLGKQMGSASSLGGLLAKTRRKHERLILRRYQQLVNFMDVKFEAPASEQDQRVTAGVRAFARD